MSDGNGESRILKPVFEIRDQSGQLFLRIPPEGAEHIWDPARDVLVIAGSGGEDMARQLMMRGIKRIIALIPENELNGYPDGVTACRYVEEVDAATRQWEHDPPMIIAPAIVRGGGFTPQIFEPLWRAIVKQFQDFGSNKRTVSESGPTWVRNGLANLRHLSTLPSVYDLGVSFKDKPIVIIGPGPSLDANGAELVALKGKAVFLAFAQAARPLLKHDIVPDFIIVADAVPWMAEYFKDYPVEEVALLISATVDPALYALPARAKFVFGGNHGYDQWVCDATGRDIRLPSNGSVSGTSFALATRFEPFWNGWGCDPIILVGCDFALRGKQQYAEGSPDVPPGPATQFKTVKGWGVDLVRSCGEYLGFKMWLEHAAMAMKKKYGIKTRLINASEGGAMIDGFEHVPVRKLAGILKEPVEVKKSFATQTGFSGLAQASGYLERMLSGEIAVPLKVPLETARPWIEAVLEREKKVRDRCRQNSMSLK